MPAAADQKLITLDEQGFGGSAFYTLAPGEFLLVETVTFVVSIEPPLILYASVTYGDPGAGVFGTYSTPPFIANRPTVASSVRFSFGIGLDSDPVSVPVTAAPDESESLYDPPFVMCPLPSVPLADGQTVSMEVVGFAPDGTGADLHLSQIVIVAQSLEPAIVSGLPPYTAQPLDAQLDQAAA